MCMNSDDYEEGEIESDLDDLSKCKIRISTTTDVIGNGDSNAFDNVQKNEEKLKNSRQGKRRRRADSKERSSSHEAKSSHQLDPVEIAEMDEYEMLCIRGASPPQGTPFCSIEESFQPLFENQPSSTYYEYERDYRYDSDCDNYSRRRSSPPVKRRRDRGRKRHGRQSRKSPPERRSGRRRSNSFDGMEENEERKMEICKFYLLDCCVKRSICKYMHSEFPCKYFHLGLDCQNEKPCKFSHGKALSEEMTQALARHIAAAPKAILGNFRRYSRDKALAMIEAKNRQLNTDNGSTGKQSSSVDNQCKTTKSSSSSSKKSAKKRLQDIWAIFSSQQLEKLKTLEITNLQQVKQMSLAQLTDIGLSLNQIGEIQKTTTEITKIIENDQKAPLKSIMTFGNRDGGDDVDDGEMNAPKSDMDMRQLLPLLTTANSTENNKDSIDDVSITDECKTDDVIGGLQNADYKIIQESFRAETKPNSDANLCLLDDEPELVIDETIDDVDEKTVCDNPFGKIETDVISVTSMDICSDLNNSDLNAEDNNDDKISTTSSEAALFDSISFDEPFEPTNFYSERAETDFKPENESKEPVLSDYDMRLPFADVIANYVPALEIDASLKSHLGVPYKLYEIIIPDKKDPAIRPENIPENTLDPRLKKLVNIINKKTDEPCLTFHLDANKMLSLVNPYKSENQAPEPSADPRKRKEQTLENNPKPIQQNFNYVLNSFLQKSKWYQNLNSKAKIDINQHLADLSTELNRFSQIISRDKKFQISTIANGYKIQEILYEIGLEVNCDGIIQEVRTPKPTTEIPEAKIPQKPEGVSIEIPSLLNMNLNQASTSISTSHFPQNTNLLLPNIGITLPSIQHQRYEFPKPGLLGIAPGIELPSQFLHNQNSLPSYSTVLNGPIWNEYPANYSISQNLSNLCSTIDELNRSQFGLQMGKRWNRKMNMKKPRRI